MSRHLVRLVLLLCLTLSSSGCAVMMLGTGHEGGSASLGDAAAQVHPDSTTRTKDQPLDVGYTVPPSASAVVEEVPETPEAASLAPEDEPTKAAKRPDGHFLAGVLGGGGAFGGQDYDGFSTAGLAIGGYPAPQWRIDLAGTYDDIKFKGEGLLDQAFQDAFDLNLDLTVRYYLTKDQTFMGVYPLAGLGTGTLFWDYGRPVTVMEDGAPKTLDGDRLNHFSFFGGAGISLLQTRYLHLGGNLTGGVRIYGWHTGSGLKNDLLKPTGFARLMIEASYKVF